MYNILSYYNTQSDMHKMNVIYKFICMFLFICILLFFKSYTMLFVVTIYTLILIVSSNVPLKLYLNNIKIITILIIFVVLLNLIFNKNIDAMILSISKTILIVLYTSVIAVTTTRSEIVNGLETLFSPLNKIKIPVSNIALSFSLSIRFIPIILKQSNKVLKSQISRGLDLKGKSVKIKIQSLTSIIIAVFMLSFKKVDYISAIMKVRMYNINKCNIKNNSKSYFDLFMLSSHVLILILYFLKEVIII